MRQKGTVLIIALSLLLPLTLLGAALAERGMLEEKMSASHRNASLAFMVAESGVERALLVLQGTGGADDGFDDELKAGGDLGLNSLSIGSGTVTVTLHDNDDGDGKSNHDADGRVILRAVGSALTGRRRVELLLRRSAPPPQQAILTEKHLELAGDFSLSGSYANIHSNTSIRLTGHPTVDGEVSTTGTITMNGGSTITGTQTEGADPVDIPHIYPPDFRPYADYVLTADCRVLDAAGAQLDDLSLGGDWQGWSCSPGNKWMISGSATPADGFFYVQGNVEISGTGAGLWSTTVVAEGSIEVSGNPNYQAHADPDHPPWIRDLLFVAGNDLVISGNPDQSFHGIMASHMEIHISGNVNFEGQIIAENGTGQEVLGGQTVTDLTAGNYFGGNATQVNNRLSPWGYKLQRVAWRELVP